MVRIGLLSAAVLAVALFAVQAQTGKGVKSGPQVGAEVPGPFHPLNVTGENAGRKACLYCQYNGVPVAVVFAREVTPAVAKLLQQLDQATVKNSKVEMASFAVFCSSSEGLDKQLEKLATEKKLSKLVLSIDNPTGPKEYGIAKDAEVTVFLYKTVDEKDGFVQRVQANHAFRKGELNDAAIGKVIADVSKIVK